LRTWGNEKSSHPAAPANGRLTDATTVSRGRFSTGFVNRRTAPGAERRQDMMQAFLDNGLGREELTQEVVLQM